MASALADASGAGADITLSSSSRTAHGFHGARGLKALVPEMHDMMLADFMDRVHTNHSSVSVGADTMAKYESDMNVTIATARKPTPITFRQYARPGWTFHAKGMWLSRHGALSNPATRNLSDCEPSFKPESTSQEQQVPGAVFYIGSSNGGYRSWTRDFELGFLVTTGSPRISQCLQRELASIERFAPQVARKEDVLARIEQIAWKRQLLGLLKTFL
jgi:phosphatidylserine/phosphatidylglycerophosphate/cardiolipin synthase-like enzyme